MTNVDMVDLLSCPFCGTDPVIYESRDIKDGYVHGYTVACHKCGIEHNDEYQHEAIAHWNSRTAPVWEPIETAPKTGQPVLIWSDGDAYTARWTTGHDHIRHEDWECFVCDGYRKHFDATHWMPLPEPPAKPVPAQDAG